MIRTTETTYHIHEEGTVPTADVTIHLTGVALDYLSDAAFRAWMHASSKVREAMQEGNRSSQLSWKRIYDRYYRLYQALEEIKKKEAE